jgi:acetamidase/formamidase
MTFYRLDASTVHYTWSRNEPPILRLGSGDVVEMQTRDGFDGQLAPPVRSGEYAESEFPKIDMSRVAPLTGPIYVENAEPGDTLSVTIVELKPIGIGVMVVWPARLDYDFLRPTFRRGFPSGWIQHFDLSAAGEGHLLELGSRALIPIRPMLGMMGTAPPEGVHQTGPPLPTGGNMDIRLLGAGATIHLPVQVHGALFSAGDGHAVQGDGELCTTGVEVGMSATLAFQVWKRISIEEPHLETADIYAITATGATLEEAAQGALERWLVWLTTQHRFSTHDAYMLLSAAADLRVNQVVNEPRLGVRIELPKAVFNASRWAGKL